MRPKQNVLSELYIRPGAVPAGQDVKTYDFGDFQIASQGIPLGSAGAAVNLGELWVSYQIALIKPRIPTESATYTDSGFAYFSGVTNNAGFAPYGPIPVPYNSIVKRASSNIPIVLQSDNTFVIECGSTAMNYEFELAWYAMNVSAGSNWRAPTAILTNCSFVNTATTGSYQNVLVPVTASVGTGCTSRYFITVPAF